MSENAFRRAVDVKATCVAMAEQPQRGGRWRRKKRKTRPKKRSVLVRLPNSWAVQVGGKQERFFCLLPIPGDDHHSSEHTMDPSDETQTPIACIQTEQEKEAHFFFLLPLSARRFPYFCPMGY
jgi:hypothetical protein